MSGAAENDSPPTAMAFPFMKLPTEIKDMVIEQYVLDAQFRNATPGRLVNKHFLNSVDHALATSNILCPFWVNPSAQPRYAPHRRDCSHQYDRPRLFWKKAEYDWLFHKLTVKSKPSVILRDGCLVQALSWVLEEIQLLLPKADESSRESLVPKLCDYFSGDTERTSNRHDAICDEESMWEKQRQELLCFAAYLGDCEVIRLVLAKYHEEHLRAVDLSDNIRSRRTAGAIAARYGNTKAARELMGTIIQLAERALRRANSGAIVNFDAGYRNPSGKMQHVRPACEHIFNTALRFGQVETVSGLLELAKAESIGLTNVHDMGRTFCTIALGPEHSAARSVELVKNHLEEDYYRLSNQPKVKRTIDMITQILLVVACDVGSRVCVRWALDHGVNADGIWGMHKSIPTEPEGPVFGYRFSGGYGRRPIEYAAAAGHSKIVLELLTAGAEPVRGWSLSCVR